MRYYRRGYYGRGSYATDMLIGALFVGFVLALAWGALAILKLAVGLVRYLWSATDGYRGAIFVAITLGWTLFFFYALIISLSK